MVFMIFINLLYLLRKTEERLGLHLDLVHTPIMAHPLLYSKNYAEKDTKKSEKRSNKKCFFLDKCDSSCYNGNITIKKNNDSKPGINIALGEDKRLSQVEG